MAVIGRKWHRDDCRAVLLPGKGCNCAEMERDALRAEVTSLRHQLAGAVESLREIATFTDAELATAGEPMRRVAERALDRLGGQ